MNKHQSKGLTEYDNRNGTIYHQTVHLQAQCMGNA